MEETVEVLHLVYNLVWRWNLDISESRSGIPLEFWNVMVEKDGDQLDRSCEK
jgi:hypothetical protein